MHLVASSYYMKRKKKQLVKINDFVTLKFNVMGAF